MADVRAQNFREWIEDVTADVRRMQRSLEKFGYSLRSAAREFDLHMRALERLLEEELGDPDREEDDPARAAAEAGASDEGRR